jgi:biopolymer transport protein ExbD
MPMDFFYPLQPILFWIAVTLSPPNTSQILVKGPDLTMAWTRQDAGWSCSTDRSLWSASADVVGIRYAAGDKRGPAKVGVSQFVKGIKDNDWQKTATLQLASAASLRKEGETFVYVRDGGTPAEKRYVLQYRCKAVAKVLHSPAEFLAGLPKEALPETDNGWDEFSEPKANKWLEENVAGRGWEIILDAVIKDARLRRVTPQGKPNETLRWDADIDLEPIAFDIEGRKVAIRLASDIPPDPNPFNFMLNKGPVVVSGDEAFARRVKAWWAGNRVSVRGIIRTAEVRSRKPPELRIILKDPRLVALPESAVPASKNTANNELTIQLTKNGLLFLQGQPVMLENLTTKLETAKAAKDGQIVIRSVVGVPYRDLLNLLDRLRKAGYTHLSFKVASVEPAAPSAKRFSSASSGIVTQLLAKMVAAEKKRTGVVPEGSDKPEFVVRAIEEMQKTIPQVFMTTLDEEQRFADGRFDDRSNRTLVRDSIAVLKKSAARLPALSQYLVEQAGAGELQAGELEVAARILTAHAAACQATIVPDTERPLRGRSAASLEFHIVPNSDGSPQLPHYPKFVAQTNDKFAVAATKELAEKGPDAARLGGSDYQWFELAGKVTVNGAVAGTYKDKRYVLLSAKEPYVLLPKTEGNDAWKVEQASASKDAEGHSQVAFRLNGRGGELFAALTKANIGNVLAVVVGGRIVSAPMIRSVIRDRGVITGQFTEQEVQNLIRAINGAGRHE